MRSAFSKKKEWEETHKEEIKEYNKAYKEIHKEEVKSDNTKYSHKEGEHYEQRRKYDQNGLRHKRNLVRGRHRFYYHKYKQIIAPDSVLHHEWIPGTADYRGVALVEKDPHRYGFIDVIQILEGEITLLTEAEIRGMVERIG